MEDNFPVQGQRQYGITCKLPDERIVVEMIAEKWKGGLVHVCDTVISKTEEGEECVTYTCWMQPNRSKL